MAETGNTKSSIPSLARRGALRSRVVSKLTGLTLAQLRYWHETRLIRAATAPGAKGVPRLYTWWEYMRLRAAKHLLLAGIPTTRVRRAIALMDAEIPNWYLLPLEEFRGQAVLQRRDAGHLVAYPARQLVLPVFATLEKLVEQGPLGELSRYSEHVVMHPAVLAGNPVVRGTRIETAFIAALVARGADTEELRRSFKLSEDRLEGALEFNRAAA